MVIKNQKMGHLVGQAPISQHTVNFINELQEEQEFTFTPTGRKRAALFKIEQKKQNRNTTSLQCIEINGKEQKKYEFKVLFKESIILWLIINAI